MDIRGTNLCDYFEIANFTYRFQKKKGHLFRWKGPTGPHRSVSEVSGRKQSSAGAGGAKRSRMPHRGCHRQVTGGGLTKVARPSGPHRSVSEVPVWGPKQWRCRRSEAEPHAPPGLSPSGDWGWTDEGRQTFRAAPERQRGGFQT